MCKKTRKTSTGQTKLVRPHHSCQFQIMRPDLLGPGTMALDPTFGSSYLIRTSFTLRELVSLVIVFRLFRLERIVLVLRVQTQQVDVQHHIYWQGHVCDALFFSLSLQLALLLSPFLSSTKSVYFLEHNLSLSRLEISFVLQVCQKFSVHKFYFYQWELI